MADAPVPKKRTRAEYLQQWAALKQERSSWIAHWQELSQYLMPRAGRFFTTDRNRGDKRHGSIYNNTGSRSLRILAAGMMAGMTSPARPWFRLATSDPDMMEYDPVKVWLNFVTLKMRDIFARSNTYLALPELYEELGCFGTGVDFLRPDFKSVIRHYPLTAGEYAVATDHRGEVTTLTREYEMTVGQMVTQFGWDKLSPTVQSMYDNGMGVNRWVPVIHLIEPRTLRQYGKRDNLNMPYASCYFEAGGNEDKLLSESGFKRFPALGPRWATSGGDIYGRSPGMEALGDVKELQHHELRGAQGLDYMTKPPLQMPTSLKEQPQATLPGGVAYHDMTAGNVIKPQFEVRMDLSHLDAKIARVEHRIGQTFYADLFLMLANDQRSGVTAREIAERHEEKLLMLGPVLERLHGELLKPLIDNTFDFMIEAGLVPPPPEELHGQDLNVEFVSMLAQAQRAVGTGSVDRLLGTVGSMALMQANAGLPVTALDKLNIDQITDGYAEMLGTDPNFIVADDQVAIIRDQRVQAAAAAQQAAAMQQAAEVAKTASQADMSGDNALTQALGQFSGYAVPGVV
jgi:hypothetical protein